MISETLYRAVAHLLARFASKQSPADVFAWQTVTVTTTFSYWTWIDGRIFPAFL
jgi:hypothetical protein